jgi:uncharacterized protein
VDRASTRREFLRTTLLRAAALASVPRLVAGAESDEQVARRALGKTGARVSILGLGLGGSFLSAFGGNNEATRSVLQRALDLDINYWDTSRNYGPSESMIAPIVRSARDRIFLVSKSGRRTYDGFRRDLETSLKTLGTHWIDVYYLHNLEPDKDGDLGPIEKGAVRAAREAKSQGLIRHFGVTGHSGARILIECMKRFSPDVVLTIFPATRPDGGRYEDELLPLAREKGIGVVAMKTVRYARGSGLRGSEHVRYALSLSGVSSAIVGLDSIAHLNENATMASHFEPMSRPARNAFNAEVQRIMAEAIPPWERPGYVDGVG